MSHQHEKREDLDEDGVGRNVSFCFDSTDANLSSPEKPGCKGTAAATKTCKGAPEEAHSSAKDYVVVSFHQHLRPKLTEFTQLLFPLLFQKYPFLSRLYSGANMPNLHMALSGLIMLAVHNIHTPHTVRQRLVACGERHVGYGVIPEYYDMFWEAFQEALSITLGPVFDLPCRAAWKVAFENIVEPMKEGHANVRNFACTSVHEGFQHQEGRCPVPGSPLAHSSHSRSTPGSTSQALASQPLTGCLPEGDQQPCQLQPQMKEDDIMGLLCRIPSMEQTGGGTPPLQAEVPAPPQLLECPCDDTSTSFHQHLPSPNTAKGGEGKEQQQQQEEKEEEASVASEKLQHLVQMAELGVSSSLSRRRLPGHLIPSTQSLAGSGTTTTTAAALYPGRLELLRVGPNVWLHCRVLKANQLGARLVTGIRNCFLSLNLDGKEQARSKVVPGSNLFFDEVLSVRLRQGARYPSEVSLELWEHNKDLLGKVALQGISIPDLSRDAEIFPPEMTQHTLHRPPTQQHKGLSSNKSQGRRWSEWGVVVMAVWISCEASTRTESMEPYSLSPSTAIPKHSPWKQVSVKTLSFKATFLTSMLSKRFSNQSHTFSETDGHSATEVENDEMTLNERSQLVQMSFEMISNDTQQFVEDVYKNLFVLHPDLKAFFSQIDMDKLSTALAAALFLTVQNVKDEEYLHTSLSRLGERHNAYGAVPELYVCLGDALLETLNDYLEDCWTVAARSAWVITYSRVANMMLEGQGYEANLLKVEDFVTYNDKHCDDDINASSRIRKSIGMKRKAILVTDIEGQDASEGMETSSFRPSILTRSSSLIQEVFVKKRRPEKVEGNKGKRPPVSRAQHQKGKLWRSLETWALTSLKITCDCLSFVTGFSLLKKVFWAVPSALIVLTAWVGFAALKAAFPKDTPVGRICDSFQEIYLFAAFIMFLREAPERAKQLVYKAWIAIDSAASLRMSYARFLAMQDLNDRRLPMPGIRVSGAWLQSIRLRGVDLTGAVMSSVDLSNADLQGAVLDKVNLRGSQLSAANLTSVNLNFADLTDINLCGADLTSASCLCANLTDANASGAIFEGSNLTGAKVDGCRFYNASLLGAKVEGVDFSNCLMHGCIMPNGEVYDDRQID